MSLGPAGESRLVAAVSGHLLAGRCSELALAAHGLAKTGRDFGELDRIVVVSRREDDGAGELLRVLRLEDARATVGASKEESDRVDHDTEEGPSARNAHKDTVHSELHHERRVGRRGDATRREHDDRQPTELGRLAEQVHRCRQLLGHVVQFDFGAARGAGDLGVDGAGVADGFDNVAGTGLTCRERSVGSATRTVYRIQTAIRTLCPDHGGTFADPSESLAKVLAAAND